MENTTRKALTNPTRRQHVIAPHYKDHTTLWYCEAARPYDSWQPGYYYYCGNFPTDLRRKGRHAQPNVYKYTRKACVGQKGRGTNIYFSTGKNKRRNKRHCKKETEVKTQTKLLETN